jgi:hypothetical protein
MPVLPRRQPPDRAVRAAAVRLSLDAALEELVDAFAADGLHPLLLKGPAFARWLYDDPSERTYIDLDLLVAPEQLEPARCTLAKRGFEQVTQRAHAHQREHHESWLRGRPPAVIELHHTIFLLEAPPRLVWQRFTQYPETIAVGAVEVLVPGPTASALLVALHALLHGVGHPKPLSDLERALERVEPASWQRAAALARELGGEDAFAAGLRLVPAGRRLAAALGLPERPAPRNLRLLAETRETAIAIERLLATAGFRPRARVVALTLVPSPRFMRARYGLARRGRRGLLCAYLLRPLELTVKLPGAMGAWTRAARAARRA